MHHCPAAGLEAGRAATPLQTTQHATWTGMESAAGSGRPARAAVALGARPSAPWRGGRLTLAVPTFR